MINSKSITWIRPGSAAPLTGATSKYQSHYNIKTAENKNSTQNIFSCKYLKVEKPQNVSQPPVTLPLSHERSARNLLTTQTIVRPTTCCKDGEMLKSSEETANCSQCGQFLIVNVSTKLDNKCRKWDR
jgi:hypothetical protein